MARRLPSYVPWHLADDEYLVLKAIDLHYKNGRLPRKLVQEIARRGLEKQLPPELRVRYFDLHKVDLVKLYQEIGLQREALELAIRLERAKTVRFEIDGYFRGKAIMVLELTIERVKAVTIDGDLLEIPLHVFEKEFRPAR